MREDPVPEPEKSEMLKGASLARIQFRRMTTMPYKPDVAAACREAQSTVLAMLSRQYGCRFNPQVNASAARRS